MIDVENYIAEITAKLRAKFGERLVYVGLQGSYLRGEATDTSDVDVMVVLDRLSVDDLDGYRAIVESLPRPDLSCGFICGADDLAKWNPLEICHLLHTTRDIYGCLAGLVPAYTARDHQNFIQLSLGNLLHLLTHNSLHAGEKERQENLPAAYQGAFFILQDLHFLRRGVFLPDKASLLQQLEGLDRQIVDTSRRLKEGETPDLNRDFPPLFQWCQQTLLSLS